MNKNNTGSEEKELRKMEAEKNRQRKIEQKNIRRKMEEEKQYQKKRSENHSRIWWFFYRKTKDLKKENKTDRYFSEMHDRFYRLLKRIGNWGIRQQIFPFYFDFFYFFLRVLLYLFIIFFLLAPVFIFLLIISSVSVGAYFYIAFVSISVAAVFMLMSELFLIRIIPLYLLDKLTLKKTVSLNVELRQFRRKVTNPMWYPISTVNSEIFLRYPSALNLFFGRDAVPCYCCFRKLTKEDKPKSSEEKYPPQFYKRHQKKQIAPKALSRVCLVMTKNKAKQFDRLFELEPTAEFEICYLKYSKVLREIRPIEGWEYAEGVAELCEKISKMYP